MRSPAWTSASSRVASTGERKYVRSLVVAGAGWRRTVTGSVPGHMTGRRVVPGGDRRPPESCVIARAGTRLVADREQGLQVVLREHLERDQRVRAADPGNLRELVGDDLRDLLGIAHAQDRDEVPLPRDGVGLGDAGDVGKLAAERGDRLALGLDQ